ncbi:MAG: DUF2752 domain-containing protein [Tannerella sp.]|jgi:hypothetical protein|nr:DUF2752 domain-containing protein [Tannerella sp.]
MNKKALFAAAILFVVIAAAVVYYLFDPSLSALFPKCPFLMLTGLKCPGCGSQRTIHALLHFDFWNAFRYNALIVITLPYLALLLCGKMVSWIRPQSRFNFLIQTPLIIWSYFAVVLIFWLTRNIFGF